MNAMILLRSKLTLSPSFPPLPSSHYLLLACLYTPSHLGWSLGRRRPQRHLIFASLPNRVAKPKILKRTFATTLLIRLSTAHFLFPLASWSVLRDFLLLQPANARSHKRKGGHNLLTSCGGGANISHWSEHIPTHRVLPFNQACVFFDLALALQLAAVAWRFRSLARSLVHSSAGPLPQTVALDQPRWRWTIRNIIFCLLQINYILHFALELAHGESARTLAGQL